MESTGEAVPENRLCRTCMSSGDDLTSLFTVVNVVSKEEPLSAILLKCTSIQVTSNDIYPQYICKQCLEKLTACYLFRDQCYRTHERLGQLYQDGSLPYPCLKQGNVQLLDENVPNAVFYKQEVVEMNEITIEKRECVSQQDCFQDYHNLNYSEGDDEGNDDEYRRAESCDNNKNYRPDDEDIKKSTVSCPEFECSECTKVFRSKYTMQRHMKVHTDRDNLRCKVCSKGFTRMADVKRHMSSHTGSKPYCCVVCNSSFTQSGSLSVHMRKHEEFKYLKKTPRHVEEKPHLCSICGMAFKHSSTLTIHVRRHIGDKPYCCKVCNMRFVSSGRLTAHMRVHTGERPFACKFCGKRFAQSTVAGKHLKTHANVKPHQCSYCLKSFSTLYYLNIHKRSHTGEKPHECTICHKTFADPKNLKQHRNVHSEDKAYLCIMCGKSFRRSHHLKSHMKIHAKCA
ncbi:hypothetical protein NQ315_016418 [Exocentrus adspersus]|uniref:Uncharacterized protein n=1 Tax=Exocentrus adspersus TaxID=1586481 RepID=A0AAV8VPC4_9CUCU|nr:hypothetical protein NQ315_016418 [Exocentrus adspersus]